jgi:hypothetical protein
LNLEGKVVITISWDIEEMPWLSGILEKAQLVPDVEVNRGVM